MDELLSLMEGSDPAASTVCGSGGDNDEGQQQHQSTTGESSTRSTRSSGNLPSSSSRSVTAPRGAKRGGSSSSSVPNNSDATSRSQGKSDQNRKAQLATVDPLTKLRINNRRTSRFDLSDAISPFQFVSTAKLASMSLRDLGSLVTVPSRSSGGGGGNADGLSFSYSAGPAPSSNSSSFTGGKTNCATMGVLFNNSGTKISPNTGKAYSIFQLGDLSTGPTVSVFLFGDAYSRHTGNGSYSGRAGSIVAILAPNILPPRRGGETSVSLSVNNADQILHVGASQDYGTCAGMIRVRRDGKFVDTRCKKYIDKRLGLYCASHKNQGLQQQVATSGGKKMVGRGNSSSKNLTYLQQFRAEGRSSSNNMNMANSASTRPTTVGKSSFASQTMGRGGMQASSSLTNALAAAGMQQETPSSIAHTAVDTPHATSSRRPALNAPLHMKKMTLSDQVTRNINPRASAATKHKRPPLTRAGKDVFGDTLNRGRTSSGSGTRTSLAPKPKPKARKVANFSGFNGSVQVPHPSRAIFGNAPSLTGLESRLPAAAASTSVAVTPSPNPGEVKERQRQLAEEMRERKHAGAGSTGGGIISGTRSSSSSAMNNPYLKGGSSMPKASAMVTSTRGAPQSTASSRLGGSTQEMMNDLFSGLEDLDKADAIAAISKYQSEAHAEQYALSRQAVNDLERKEAQKDARAERKRKMKGKGGAGSEDKIQTEWICLTCGTTTGSRPIACINRGHKIKKKREIKSAATREESRDRINKKRAEDGGLQLGSGLEWSGFKGA